MINEKYKKMLAEKSVIRTQSEYATGLGKEIGYDKVFDYSLGNPSVPTHENYNQTVIELHKTMETSALHGYSPSLGNTQVREKVAASLKKRFAVPYETEHIFMTSGAASALGHALRAVTKPGDEVITFAPFFTEYKPYVGGAGAILKVVPAQLDSFQINFDCFVDMMNENVHAVLINSPNNPSGVIYTEETIKRLAEFLCEKEKEYGHAIFIISDEPYREITFEHTKVPYTSKYYHNTLSCYSFSKSLSLPGERIGYVAVSPCATDSEYLVPMMGEISREIGHNCPSSSVQLAIAEVLDKTSDLSVYEENMNILYEELISLGFEVVKPNGTFYIFPKALEDDAMSFCMKARKYNLILVPSDNFGVKGYFRMAYCIETEKTIRSLEKLREFVENEYSHVTSV